MTSTISACSTGSSASPRLALRGLRRAIAGPFDLTVAAGECVAVAGPSGAGKSLFLRMIADLDPNDGAVALDGHDRAGFAIPDWRRQVVYCPAESGWWAETVAEHFTKIDRERLLLVAPRLGLDAALTEAPVDRLSSGERQRLALARALLLDPKVLLADEPTGPLDPDNTARVEALLAEHLRAGMALVLVTHDRGQAGRLARRHLRLEAGRFVTS